MDNYRAVNPATFPKALNAQGKKKILTKA